MSTLAKRLIPLADRVLIKRAQAPTKTAGGVFLPESAQKKEQEGEVVAVGPGSRTKDGDMIPMSLSVGDKVLVPEYGGHKIELEDEEYQLFRHDDILGKFKD